MRNLRIRLSFVFALLMSGNLLIYSQNADSLSLPRPTNNATLLGIGSVNLYDTYLSPLEYKGTSFRLVNERMKQLSWFQGRFTRQQTIEIEFATGENPAKNAREYWFFANYNWGGHYNIYKDEKFRFSAGAIWDVNAGVLYNERNSNNPASARLYTNINLSVIGFYKWKFATVRWQMDTPIAGVLFSPRFGQSYYEISLGNTVGNVNLASLHNQRALRNYITVDFPVNKFSFRVGYLGSYYQTKVHGLITHTYSNSFMIGLVSESVNLSGNNIKKNKAINSSYYLD
ncbi:MAG: DUF3316 domain-containing protein [Dysgonomonas sp.]